MEDKDTKFTEGFFWGAATASYQVEGGIFNNNWAVASDSNAGMENGKPKVENKVPEALDSADHYNRYEEDFDIAQSLGHNCNRISIEWSRIEPEEGKFDEKEIQHYRSVLQAMRDRGLEPFVTFWHFTLPIWFEKKGGFTKRKNVGSFVRYCKYVADNLGDLCTHWATINEPNVYAKNSFLMKTWPPFKRCPSQYFRVLKNLAIAHIEVYKLIKNNHPNLEIGIVKDNINFTSNRNPINIFIRTIVDYHWNHRFLKILKGNYDAIGLNYYFSKRIGKKGFKFPKSDMGWDLNAHGMYEVLIDLKKYGVPVYISEAGLADEKDEKRAQYITELVQESLKAIKNGVDLRGFMYWSLIDNYEWAYGYEKKFGLVSFDWKTKERTIRPSAYVYKKICDSNGSNI
jgi:beta-glucosidase